MLRSVLTRRVLSGSSALVRLSCRYFSTTIVRDSPAKEEFRFSEEQVHQFERDGFIIVDRLIQDDVYLELLKSKLEPLFLGNFETGVYPDEWHWRKGMSLPHITREICNAWKSDKTIASLALSSTLARLCSQLGRWSGARIGQDDIWWKPPSGGSPIAFHCDSSYISVNLKPAQNSITCWVALDDTLAQNNIGTLEYLRGSHKWPEERLQVLQRHDNSLGEFHNPDSDQLQVLQKLMGNEKVDVVKVRVRPGGVAFHHQDLIHGSGANTSESTPRRSVGIHLLRSDCTFGPQSGYIYSRYQLKDNNGNNLPDMNETFFPILWTNDNYRTTWLKDYCDDPKF